tara:strand:- start:2909 stop:3148 length:240 start_codon:yes stop_codon:yes gene_type:complete
MPDLIHDLMNDLIPDLIHDLMPDLIPDLTPDLIPDLINIFHILFIRKRRGRLSSQAIKPQITFRRSTLAPSNFPTTRRY